MKDKYREGGGQASYHIKLPHEDGVLGRGYKGFCDAPDASGGWLLEYFYQRVSSSIEPGRR